MNRLQKNQKGQGTTEYIVIIGLVLAALFIFWPKIKDALTTKGNTVASNIAKD